MARRLPVGAETVSGGTHFRVWAPKRRRVDVLVEDRAFPLAAEKAGYFSGMVAEAGAGSRYRFRLDGGDAFPDPASRFQPDGPHGPSQVVDPTAYEWRDTRWKGCRLSGQVLYEMHVGTFTPEGTWDAARAHLAALRETGITVLEVMPIADFPGRFGWGYDGVNLFAPTRLYGTPGDLRRFVDDAHGHGLGVILDVVYNHLGPDGNYISQFTDTWFTDRHVTDWGEPINFEGEGGRGVREFYVANARYWIEEYHFDGLRLDATQNVYDDADGHVLAEITHAAREAAGGRAIVVVAENEPQDVRLVKPRAQGGYGIDALWNDDLHHSAAVALTGRSEAYYTDYEGAPQEFVSAMKHGYLYQGQWYSWQKQRRGTPARGIDHAAFVTFIENHDQVANTARGERMHRLAHPGRLRALTAMILLGPGTPMLFQGQEFAASAPFLFFADHEGDLGDKVRAGRREFLSQFRSLARKEWDGRFADPSAEDTFLRSKIDHEERARNVGAVRLHADLLRLRREDAVIASQGRDGFDGAVLAPSAFVLRWSDGQGDDRLLVVNLGPDLHRTRLPEPLLAPPFGRRWTTLWSSEAIAYGGTGTSPVETDDDGWRIPGEAAVLLGPMER